MNHCIRHFEEPIAAICGSCSQPFCRRCLVYAFGPKKPPYCVGCALAEAGVRQNARSHGPVALAPDRGTIKAQRKAQREALKLERRHARLAKKATSELGDEPVDLPPPPSSQVPAPSTLGGAAEAATHTRAV